MISQHGTGVMFRLLLIFLSVTCATDNTAYSSIVTCCFATDNSVTVFFVTELYFNYVTQTYIIDFGGSVTEASLYMAYKITFWLMLYKNPM